MQKTTDVSMAVLEPIEQLAADADELQADLGSLVATMEAERRQLQEYEEQTDADIRKKLVEADGTCNQVGRDAQERLAREQAKFAEEKAVINAEADHILAGIGTRRGAIRGQMVALQKSLTTIEADIQRKLAMAGESAAELRPELERHEEEKMLQVAPSHATQRSVLGLRVANRGNMRVELHEISSRDHIVCRPTWT